MRYFDPTKAEDLHLVHASVREHPETVIVSVMAEADVVLETGLPADAAIVNDALREAMRRTIADVASHRLRYYDAEAGVVASSVGSRSRSRKRPLDPLWPGRWRARLRAALPAPITYHS